MPTPRDATLEEFTAYYNADELHAFIDDALLEHADESGARLVHILGSEGAAQAAELLRAAAGDPAHPLLAEISENTLFDWNGEPESWRQFQRLAGRIADKIDDLS